MAEIPAAVVGLCTHGLSTVRSLGRYGVTVHALESNARLPGTRTRSARVHLVEQVNGPGVVEALVSSREGIGGSEPPVLFLMNDNMVREVASAWPRLADAYRLSWSRCRDQVLRLQKKSEIEEQCDRAGLRYPRSTVFDATMQVDDLVDRFEGPVIVKPVRPLSRFKVKRLDRAAEIRRVVDQYRSELPFLVQDWVPGSDETLFFCALYLEEGDVVASYVGQKIRSHPPALGGTSMARSGSAPGVLELTRQFFEGLNMSGPVSLELKRDPQGRYWVIEPTVGRTDFWLECCIANGVDLPVIEYCRLAGRPLPETRQASRAVWIETEMDPRAIYWYLFSPRGWLRLRLPVAFPYWRRGDLPPFFAALGEHGRRLLRRVAGRFRRLVGGGTGLEPAR